MTAPNSNENTRKSIENSILSDPVVQSSSYSNSELSNYGSIDKLLQPPKKKEKSI